ncbi:MAG: TonB-dependent receptor [Verrucomicrobia bacterium]|nr:TonB-dependent receptor [Verrucomicrobiota bacterium]
MNSRRLIAPLIVLLAGGLGFSHAQENADAGAQRIIVTATRVETPIEKVGSSISVVTAEDLKRTRIQDVKDALQWVPGVSVSQNGGPGQNSGVFLRGAPSGFTRVMMDGVEMNDPGGIGTSFDFAHLNVTAIERIEVLRGPQSTLYGSDAMAGVINVVTKKGTGAPSAYASAEGGSFNTIRLGAGAQGQTNGIDYTLDVAYHETDGISAFEKRDGFSERDGYENLTLSSRVGAQVTDLVSLDALVRFVNGESDYDSYDASFSPSEEGRTESEQLFARLAAKMVLLDGVWEQTLGASKTVYDRGFLDSPGVDDSFFDSEILGFDWKNNVFLESQTITVGVDWQQDEATSDGIRDDYDVTGYYLQDAVDLQDNWLVTLGGRVDDHSAFGSEATYRSTTVYDVPTTGTKLKGSWGTGYKAPSLFQLFASSPFVQGNPDLGPQASEGWDAGVEQDIVEDVLRVGVTYFDIDYDDLVTFVFDDPGEPGTYRNSHSAESRGVEAFVATRPFEKVDLRVDYTYLDNEDKSPGNDFELRRPKDQVSATLGVQATEAMELTLYGVYVGSRKDIFDVTLEEYFLFNLAASYEVSEALELYVRVENLLDEDYQQIDGFGTAGAAAYAGFRGAF